MEIIVKGPGVTVTWNLAENTDEVTRKIAEQFGTATDVYTYDPSEPHQTPVRFCDHTPDSVDVNDPMATESKCVGCGAHMIYGEGGFVALV